MTDLELEAHAAYTLVQRGRYAEATDRLPRLIAAADAAQRPDLCARAWTWLGHAHLYRSELGPARRALRQAAALATALGDDQGLAAISQLRQAVGAKAMQAAPPAQADTPIGRACLALDAGDHALGARLAREARDAARADEDPRGEVLAWLALARVPTEADAAVRAAADVADRSGDRNLVTAVAHAARAAGVVLAPKVF